MLLLDGMLKLINRYELNHSVLTLVTSLVVGVLGISSTALFARDLGASEFGVLSFLFIKGALFSTICMPGLNVVISREIIQGRLDRVSGLSFAFLILSYFVFLFALIIYSFEFMWAELLLPFIYVPVIVGEFSFGILQAKLQFHLFNLVRLLNSLITLLFASLAFYSSLGLSAAQLFIYISISKVVLLSFFLTTSLNFFKNKSFEDLFSLIKEGALNTLLGLGHSSFNYWVNHLIGVGSRDLGFYNAGSSLPNRLKDHIKNVLNVLLVSRVSAGRKKYEDLSGIYSYLFLFLMLCSVGNMFLSESYVVYLLGADFADSHPVFSIYGFIISIGIFTSYFLNGFVYFNRSTNRFLKVSSSGLALDFIFVGAFFTLGNTSGKDLALAILCSRSCFLILLYVYSTLLRSR